MVLEKSLHNALLVAPNIRLLTYWQVHQNVTSSKVNESLSVEPTWTLFVLKISANPILSN